jgi:hypothetical protein
MNNVSSWLLMSLVTAVARGILADILITDPRGFGAINDEDFGAWLLRHGGHRDVLEFPLIRGLSGTAYDQTKVVTTTRYWRVTGRIAA